MARIRSSGFQYVTRPEGSRPMIKRRFPFMKHFQSSFCRTAAALAAMLALAGSGQAAAKLNVVTTTQDLAALAREVGGDRITVESIAKGYQDPHFVEAKPSYLLRLMKADLLVVVGL